MKKTVAITLIITILFSFSSVFAMTKQSDEDIMPILAEFDIMQGDANGNLRLDDYVSRAEFTKVAVASSAYRNMVASNIAITPFKDVLSSNWAAPYIKVAISAGICSGYPDGTFKPDRTVSYEEAITMFLKVLGYTDADFGISWPYGQIGIAQKIGLCDDLNISVGDALTRRDVVRLCYNLLNTKPKGSNNDYVTALNYNIIDDVILIASSNEDTSVGSGKVCTSAGTYKVSKTFNYKNVGKKGSIVVKNNDEIIGFVANDQQIHTYNVYQVLGSDVIVMKNPLCLQDNISLII